MILSSTRRGALYGSRCVHNPGRARVVRRLLAAEPQLPPSASGTLPPPPTPPDAKKRGIFSRLFWYTTFLTLGFYAGSTAASTVSDEYRTFFVEHVPLGERIIDYTDSQGWDRAPVIGKVSQTLNGSRLTERKPAEKATEKVETIRSKATQKATELKEAASEKVHIVSKVASEKIEKVKAKAKESTDPALKSAKEMKAVPQPIKDQGIKFSEGVEELARKAEDALKTAVADVVPTPSVPPLSESNAAEPGSAPEVDVAEEVVEEVFPSNVYGEKLPLGFEPPPGYVLPKPKKILPRTPKVPSSSPKPSPLLAPEVAPFSASEPIIGQLASTIDALTRLIEQTPSASAKATSQINKAKLDLTNLAKRVDGIKAEERSLLEKRLSEQTTEYNKKLSELETQTQERFINQEKGWRESFGEEQKKLTESYKKKLESELETQSEIINKRLEEEVITQGVDLQRRWIRDLKVKVEEEREGRLSKLEELASSLKKLERLTLDNASYLEQNLHLHALWSSLRSLTKVLDAQTRTPYRQEMQTLRNVVHHHRDEVVESALNSLDATSSPDIGIEPLADLTTWFNTSVAPSLLSVALVPDQSAGVLSHVAAHLLSSVQFRRHGLVEGDDVLSVVARAEYYLNEKDLDSATRELNQLGGPARGLLKDWLDAARRRLEVQQALQVIEARATISSLLLL